MSLTKKEWDVLLYFIEREGYETVGLPVEGLQRPFIAYPARIERDLGGTVSRVWARKVCESFEAKGIMGRAMLRPPRQNHETEHYYLRRNLAALRVVVRLTAGQARPPDRQRLFSYRYFRSLISRDILREVLAEKHVGIRRILPLQSWDAGDARRLFERDGRNTGVGFDTYMRMAISETLPEAIKIDGIPMRFPVFPASMPKDERERSFKACNRDVIARYPFIGYGSSAVRDHYAYQEERLLILPLLALTRLSAGALEEFLNGDWKPGDTGTIEDTLFRLLFTAISDLAATRSIVGEGIAKRAWLRNVNGPAEDALLAVALDDGHCVYFDGGFDTDHDPSEEAPDFWVETRYGFDLPGCGGMLLGEDNVKDVAALVRRLGSRGDPLAAHIAGKCSFETQHFLRYADPSVPLPPGGIRRLLDDLNEIILGECVYGEQIYGNTALSPDTQMLLKNTLSGGAAPSSAEGRVLNRLLLGDAFPGLLTRTII